MSESQLRHDVSSIECSIEVVNVKNAQCDVYCGRDNDGCGMDQNEFNERGAFGNPYRMRDGYTRDEAVAKFAEFWVDQWQNDPQLRCFWAMKVRQNDRLRLGCWCAPKKCHVEVIRKTLIEVFEL